MRRPLAFVALVAVGAIAWAQAGTGLGMPTGTALASGTAIREFTSPEGETALGPSFAGALSSPEGRAALAMTTPEYPVTPGDVYTLSFITAGGAVVSSILVDADYRVDLANLGRIEARNLRFADLRALVEKKVLAAYALSAPQLVVKSCGLFPVYVSGEVLKDSIIYPWGLSRLSELWGKGLTPYASSRDIVIRARDGSERRYDLFRAWRDNDLSQDPYLRPQAAVIFPRYDRSIVLGGEVRRPGTYQLLRGEGLRELIEYYGDGLKPSARGDYATIVRRADSDKPDGERLFFDATALDAASPELRDGDTVTIPSRNDYLPVVYFEGAIATGMEAAKQYAMDRQPFRPGDRLTRAFREIAPRISPMADLRRAFIARKGVAQTIPVDLERLLFAYDPSLDIELAAEDRIVIPFGSLDVFVTGEVTKSAWVNTAALTRLSQAVAPLLTKYSSIRDIAVLGSSGVEQRFDLFRAERYGELEQDPFLKPGDVVTVETLSRAVTIAGEVRRPGIYQLLAGEGLVDLVETYAQGFTEQANKARIGLTRVNPGTSGLGSRMVLDWARDSGTELLDRDTIAVAPLSDILPVAYFEGALGVGVEGQNPQVSNRIPYTFYPGELLSSAVKSLRKQFSAVSNLEKAYILRGAERIPVNIAKYLYEKDYSTDYNLLAGDTIVVPFRQFFVSVAGAVRLPGRYPYVPDRSWEYYINLAGGFDKDKNSRDRLEIFDVTGKRRVKTVLIEPEDTIVAASNSFVYYLEKFSPVITTLASLASILAVVLSL